MQPSLLLATAAKKTANMLKNAADSEKTRGGGVLIGKMESLIMKLLMAALS